MIQGGGTEILSGTPFCFRNYFYHTHTHTHTHKHRVTYRGGAHLKIHPKEYQSGQKSVVCYLWAPMKPYRYQCIVLVLKCTVGSKNNLPIWAS